MRSAQIPLFPHTKKSVQHGGDTRKGKRKVARPLCTKRPIHLVLRSEKAKGEWHLHHPRNRRRVAEILDSTAAKTGVRVLGFQNVGNHLHVVILGKSHLLLKEFLRLFPQRLSLAITGARRGKPQGRFFDATAFTRISGWGKAYDALREYLFKNALEALGYNPAEVRDLRERAARFTPNEIRWPPQREPWIPPSEITEAA